MMKKENFSNTSLNICFLKNFLGTQKQVRISLGKRSLAGILYKSIAGRYRPVKVTDGPIKARYRFIKNAYWGSIVVRVISFPVCLSFHLSIIQHSVTTLH